MIVLDKSSWLRMVFAVRGSSLVDTWPRIALVILFASIVTWTPLRRAIEPYTLTTTPFSLIGVSLAIFFGFRNNESYDRYWEGRTLWGRMVNVSRSFTRQVLTLVRAEADSQSEDAAELRRSVVRSTIAYVHAFRHHLRGSSPEPELRQHLSDEDRERATSQLNVPLAILQQIGERIQQANARGWIDTYHVPVLEESLTEMTGVQGGCERIKSTPIPFTYNVLIHRIVAIYCLALPFGLIDSVGDLTPIVVGLISYAFFGLDAIGDEIEQPFELDKNDLPLDYISRMIEINLLELLGETDTPPLIEPKDGVLL